LEEKSFIQNVIRSNPDIVYCFSLSKNLETAQKVKKIVGDYMGREVSVNVVDVLQLTSG
jgi:hypothetical protein